MVLSTTSTLPHSPRKDDEVLVTSVVKGAKDGLEDCYQSTQRQYYKPMYTTQQHIALLENQMKQSGSDMTLLSSSHDDQHAATLDPKDQV